MALYHEIANKLSAFIDSGVYPPGARLPGVRRLSQQFEVSISTIVQAQRQLENSGLIEARPRSGFYVSQKAWEKPKLPTASQTELKPIPVTGQELVLQLAQAANHPDFIQLGAAVPDVSFLPVRAFQRSLSKVVRQQSYRATNYAFPPGVPELQQQIARRMHFAGSSVLADRVLIANGCQEALSLALQTVAKPGDVIAIETPTFYGLLQVIESLGMKALEIPTDPVDGISLSALEFVLEQWQLKACVLMPNYSNPLGGQLSDVKKQRLVELAKRYRITLIEDDIYGDLGYSGKRPTSLHSFDLQSDTVIYCSSFSKTVAQGLRIGWMVLPDALYPRAEYLKYVANLAAPTLPQLALADFLEQGGYDRYLRQVQAQYQHQVELFTQAISKYFPAGTKVTQPEGGFVLWVELDEKIDTLKLSHWALQHKITIAPGLIFSASQKYRNCLRLSCAQTWTPTLEKALMDLGKECSLPSVAESVGT